MLVEPSHDAAPPAKGAYLSARQSVLPGELLLNLSKHQDLTKVHFGNGLFAFRPNC